MSDDDGPTNPPIDIKQSVMVALVQAPMVSATAITIFLSIGAFRGFREGDFENAPATTVVRETGKHF